MRQARASPAMAPVDGGIPSSIMPRYTGATRRRAFLLLRRRAEAIRSGIVPADLAFRAIARAVGVASDRTIRMWDRALRVPRPVPAHPLTRGRRPLLAHEQRRILVGWVLHQGLTRQAPTARDVAAFAMDAFGARVGKVYVSKLLTSCDVHSHRRRGASARDDTSHIRDQVVHFLRDVDRLALEPAHGHRDR